MTTLVATDFRDYSYDEKTDRYYAIVDVQGHRGLYRAPCVRVEKVYRERGSFVWFYERNNRPAPLRVQLLEAEYKKREIT